ncbi:MAG: hypothetical protein IPO46_05210 [Chitinophagaceae bacterium]|jgi:hypothetical protein|nr:hypothetical protein [Chitinophagaceae bacterium]MBP6046524.1 hypothetical protein [Ferruginibacter sp.]NMD29017.1 hypothetical protein [Bacteroidota bacterium]MBK7089277.1 hypothetical protein [Chitinophagaceae bacterium]MBK8929319.1 hypothetical protein [Chitinophagaceae bacterium]
MKQYLSNWNLMRLMRLAAGIFILIQGIQINEWIFIVIGALFTLMPLLNMGCCGAGTCKTPVQKFTNNTGNVNFEEIK